MLIEISIVRILMMGDDRPAQKLCFDLFAHMWMTSLNSTYIISNMIFGCV
jgi:hypothetical protein